MKYKLLRPAAVATVLVLASGFLSDLSTAQEAPPLHLETLAPGVIAAMQTAELRFKDTNSVLIFDPATPQAGAVVVDLPLREGAAGWWLEQLATLAPSEIRFLVNTHWHSDHTQSNQVLKEAVAGLVILGADNLTEEVPERAAAFLANQKERMPGAIAAAEERLEKGIDREGNPLDEAGKEALRQAIEGARQRMEGWERVRFYPPDVTYPTPEEARITDPVTLHIGSVAVELYPFKGHTLGDTVVYLPQHKILITGDLLDDLPYGGHGYFTEWIAALEALKGLDFEILVPGHGYIHRGEEGYAHLEKVASMFRFIQSSVQEGVAAGRTLEEIRETLDLRPHREALAGEDPVAQKEFDGFLPETIERAYKLATGQGDP